MTVTVIMKSIITEKMREETDESSLKSLIKGLYIRCYRAEQKISEPEGKNPSLAFPSSDTSNALVKLLNHSV